MEPGRAANWKAKMLLPSTSPTLPCSSDWIAEASRSRFSQAARLIPPKLAAGPSVPLMIQVLTVSGMLV